MTKYGKIVSLTGATIFILIVVLVLVNRFKKSVANTVERKRFVNENTFSLDGKETLNDSEAAALLKRLFNDLSWFGADWTIYDDIFNLSDSNIGFLNNAYVSDFADKYDYKYPNLAELIKEENIDPTLGEIKLLKRFESIFPGFTYSNVFDILT